MASVFRESTPATEAPNPALREADSEGSSQRIAQPSDHPDRAGKGDLDPSSMPEPRPLTTKKPPWKGLK